MVRPPVREVLVLRALGLGDLLTGIPAYRGLRRHFSGHRLILAAPPEFEGLAKHTGAFDELLPTPGLVAIDWQRPPPDVVVNLHGRGPRSHQILLELSPRRRIGFRSPGWSGPEWRSDEHEVARWCRLLDSAGIAADPAHLRMSPPALASPAPGAVVIHPGAGYPSRCWPVGRYADVARRLAALGLPVVVSGSARERPMAEQVARAGGLPAGSVFAGDLDLLGFAALIAGAHLVICGDTGAGHLATAFATPSVLLFGPVPPALWGPPPAQRRHRVIWHGPHHGDPLGPRPDPALMTITPDEVMAAAQPLLRARRGPAPQRPALDRSD